jgi:hypothetical protein
MNNGDDRPSSGKLNDDELEAIVARHPRKRISQKKFKEEFESRFKNPDESERWKASRNRFSFGDMGIIPGVDAPPSSIREFRGVTLTRAALMLNDDEDKPAKLAKKRWQNITLPTRLPDPIGTSLRKSQEYIYEPSALCNFLLNIGDIDGKRKSEILRDMRKRQVLGRSKSKRAKTV